MQLARDTYKMLRWRLLPVRYAGKARTYLQPVPTALGRTKEGEQLDTVGHAQGPRVPADLIEAIRELYAPRIAEVKPTHGGHPFTNLIRAEDMTADNPIVRFAFSPEVLDRAHDYFGGRFLLDSLQLLYSWPTEGPLRESQMWHKDYGDTKSLHCVAYVNDVTAPEHGPFGFVDRVDTQRIAAYPIIRRIPDDKFARELGDGTHRTFYGEAGESVWIDAANCYHYGSRCKTPRLAIFVTFNTDRPMIAPVPLVSDNKTALLEAAQTLRSDLSEAYLRRILAA